MFLVRFVVSQMTRLGMALEAYQQKFDVENRQMAKEIGISASSLSRIKSGTMPDALGLAKVILWLAALTHPFDSSGEAGK